MPPRQHDGHDEPDLIRDVQRTLEQAHPLGLLGLASSMLAVLDPRRRGPFDRDPDPGVPSRDKLMQTFLGIDRYETSALLAVLAELAGDDVARARARREVASRGHVLPAWLDGLHIARADRAVELVHVLGDSDNVMVGVRLPGGHELSVVVTVDHNMGALVSDAFAVPKPLPELIAQMTEANANPDITCNDIDPADARARISEAVKFGAISFPPCETDSWPACRPLVEWVTRLLPEGGAGYQRPDWDDEALKALTERFLGSPFGAGFGDGDHRGLLESLLWFGSGYGPGDPLRWSPAAVEILLVDWIPRKIVADASYLAKAPALLRAFIKFCHHERGIRAELTTQTLDAVDRYEPTYQRTIRSPRAQGPDALFAAMGALDPESPWPIPPADDPSFSALMIDTLRRAVGGGGALARLDDAPLPDEPFAWDAVAPDVHDRVAEVLGLVDRCCDEQLDVEYRTACRRFLARAAAGDPEVFRRRARPETAAAAVCWIIGKANELFSPAGDGRTSKDLMGHFGLTGSPQRAGTLLRAAGFGDRHYGSIDLGSPDYLTSARRRRILARYERYRAMDDE